MQHSISPFFTDRLSYFLICSLIVSVTFLLKFAIPLGGDQQLFLTVLIIYAVIGLGIIGQKLIVNARNLGAYLLLMGVMISTQILGGTNFSIPSLLMFSIIHFPYIFRIKDGAIKPYAEILFYQKVMIILAVIGIIQYFSQFVIGYQYAFFLDVLFPQDFIMQHFNGLNNLGYKIDIFKSNGFFVQEPSNFSQFLALAIIIELVFFLNWKRLALYFFALALTFSGTGLITLLILTPFYLISKKRIVTLFLLISLVVSSPIWTPLVGLGRTVERVEEFSNKNSSAFSRFISPYLSIENKVVPEGANAILFGLGAGSLIRTMSVGVDYGTATSTWGKIIYEYGVIGALAYFSFMAHAMFCNRKNLFIVFALTIQFYILGEHILPPTVHAIILALLVWSRTKSNDIVELDGKGLFPKLKDSERKTIQLDSSSSSD